MYQSISSSSSKKMSIPRRRRSVPSRWNSVLYDIYNIILEYLQDDPIAKVGICDFKKSKHEAELCLNRDKDSQNLDTVCKTTNPTCRLELRCNRRYKKWHCEEGEHIYTKLMCCYLTCKELLPQRVVQNIDPLNRDQNFIKLTDAFQGILRNFKNICEWLFYEVLVAFLKLD